MVELLDELRLLIVEDDNVFRNSLVKILEKKNFSVHSVAGIMDAQTRLELIHYDLVISDVNLPDGNGLTLYENNCDLPFVLMSSTRLEISLKANYKLFFIEKPFQIENLLDCISIAIKVD